MWPMNHDFTHRISSATLSHLPNSGLVSLRLKRATHQPCGSLSSSRLDRWATITSTAATSTAALLSHLPDNGLMRLRLRREIGLTCGSRDSSRWDRWAMTTSTAILFHLPDSGLVSLRSRRATRRACGSRGSSRARRWATSRAHRASNQSCMASRSSASPLAPGNLALVVMPCAGWCTCCQFICKDVSSLAWIVKMVTKSLNNDRYITSTARWKKALCVMYV